LLSFQVAHALACVVLNLAPSQRKTTQAEQAAEKWHLWASGVKTPDESNALTSWLKPRPTNLPAFPQPVTPAWKARGNKTKLIAS
jgi:hypothetical protein